VVARPSIEDGVMVSAPYSSQTTCVERKKTRPHSRMEGISGPPCPQVPTGQKGEGGGSRQKNFTVKDFRGNFEPRGKNWEAPGKRKGFP